MYTAGVWVVQEGREDEFSRAWRAGVDRLSLEFPEIVFRLLRDLENPRRFVSLTDGWRSREQIESAWRQPAFETARSELETMVESIDMAMLELAAEVS